MKITREQYHKAVEQLPKLKKAELTIATWEKAMKAGNVDVSRVSQIETKDGKLSITMEVNSVPAVASSKSA